MLDVMHVFFEEDLVPIWEEHSQAKSQAREVVYQQLYNTEYKYKLKKQNQNAGDDDWLSADVPQDMRETKPYIPPTNPEDLPGILDGPLG